MTDPSASLTSLRDIAVPEPPPFWPPAPGVWLLAAVALALVVASLLVWRRHRAANAYRRAGLVLLEDARTARDVNIVLKRVALAVFPRTEVAPLFGEDWAVFLDASCRRTSFAEFGRIDDGEAGRELHRLAGTWIRHHRAPSGV